MQAVDASSCPTGDRLEGYSLRAEGDVGPKLISISHQGLEGRLSNAALPADPQDVPSW